MEKALTTSVANLELSQPLLAAVAQDVAAERNAWQLLEAQMDFKEALAGQLYRKVRIAENLSHQTGAAFEVTT